MRSSGWRPFGRRNRPSKPTARSRLPRAESWRCENASRPEILPWRSFSQVSASVPIVTSGLRRVTPAAVRTRSPVLRISQVRPMSPRRSGRSRRNPCSAPEVAVGQGPERLLDGIRPRRIGGGVRGRAEPRSAPYRATGDAAHRVGTAAGFNTLRDAMPSERPIRLHDTRSGSSRALVPREPGRRCRDLRLRAHGLRRASTSGTPARSSSSRSLKRFFAHEGLETEAGHQRHRRERRDLRRRAGRRACRARSSPGR